MRIAVVHSSYSAAQPSGENAVVLDQVSALRSAGHEVHLLARETEKVDGGRLYNLTSAFSAAAGVGPDPSFACSALCFQSDQVFGQAAANPSSMNSSRARLSWRHAVASGLRLASSGGSRGSSAVSPGPRTRP
jgi:hypothetical protein